MTKMNAENTAPHSELPASAVGAVSRQSMLRSIKRFYGHPLRTAEGEIGTVKDFYFDDQHWAVRYVVADTGSWLPGRLVLLSPHAFGNFCQDGDSLLVNLTRKRIEDSPAIETHKPLSRQYEEEYFRHYGWPSYWNGGELWGATGFPVAPPPHLVPTWEETPGGRTWNGDDPHLRSAKGVVGYHIQTHEGVIGHVTDFMIDDRSWAIRHLVVKTGHWYAGKEIVISPTHVERLSYEECTVFVNVSKQTIEATPEFHTPALGAA